MIKWEAKQRECQARFFKGYITSKVNVRRV